jgi:hypothetical protein
MVLLLTASQEALKRAGKIVLLDQMPRIIPQGRGLPCAPAYHGAKFRKRIGLGIHTDIPTLKHNGEPESGAR